MSEYNEFKMSTKRLTVMIVITSFTIILPIYYIINWIFTTYRLLPNRIEKQTGIISKKILTAPLDKITDIQFRQGLISRILGYGDVVINTAGTGYHEIILQRVDNPSRLIDQIKSK